MRKLIALLIALGLALPIVVGCDQDERRVERRDKREVRGEPHDTVVPDAPADHH